MTDWVRLYEKVVPLDPWWQFPKGIVKGKRTEGGVTTYLVEFANNQIFSQWFTSDELAPSSEAEELRRTHLGGNV